MNPADPLDDPGSIAAGDRRSALGAGAGFVVVIATFGAAGFNSIERQWAVGVAILLGAVLAEALPMLRSALHRPGLAPLAIVGALVATALCVPETDQMLAAAFLPGVLLALELVGRAQARIEWYWLAAASVGWTGLYGSAGRQSALAGALFSWWCVLLPVGVVWWRAHRGLSTSIVASVSSMAIAFTATAVVARTGGLPEASWPAALAITIAVAVTVPLALAAGRLGRANDATAPEPGSA